MKFNHLDVPTSWQHYWTRYPEGYTVMEALITWVSQVDAMVDNVNSWNTYLDDFVLQFDTNLQNTVTGILEDWDASGFLAELINEYTNERIDTVENTIEHVNNNKVDKTGTGQVTWANIAQDARENISGGTTAVVGKDAVLDDNIAANALRLKKMDNTDVHLINPANSALILNDDYNKLNELGAMASGDTQFYTSGTVSVNYVNNTTPFPEDKMVNATYTGNINFGANININIENKNTIPVFGLWVKKSDIVDLGNEGLISLSFRGDNGKFYSGEWLSIFNAQNIGYTSRRVETNYTTTTTVMAEFYGYIFIEVRLTHIGDTVKTLSPRFNIGNNTSTGSIQTVGYKYVHTQNRLLPHFNYPANTEAIVPTNEELDQKIKNIELLASTEFTGHEGNIVGDSIAAPFGSYATKVEEIAGTGHIYRHAIGGRPMANGTTAGDGGNTYGKVWTDGVTTPYVDFKFSILSHATNDFKLDVALGEVQTPGSTFDTNTFAGAYQDLVEYILGKNPTISLLLMTPLQRNNGGYNTTSTNTAGHKLVDYVNVIKEIGKLYSLPVFDAYNYGGINTQNLDVTTSDGLHPNAIGYTIVGTRLAKWFKDNAVIV